MVTYEDMVELIRLGAYRRGSNAAVDEAIHYHESLESFLAQGKMKPIRWTKVTICFRAYLASRVHECH